VAVAGRAFPIVLAALALLLALPYVRYRARRRETARRFRERFGAGKDLLIVYTESPHWQPYIEQHWLPRWGERAVVLNRTRPWKEADIEAALWRAATGSLEHTPVAIVVPPDGDVRVVRFWRAFRDHKHGKDRRLRAAEAELEAVLAKLAPG